MRAPGREIATSVGKNLPDSHPSERFYSNYNTLDRDMLNLRLKGSL
jgi:hypothetical protein